MKKVTLFAAMAAVAASASAQYNVESPYAKASVVEGKVQTFDIMQGGDDLFDGLYKAGQSINDWRLNNDTRNLWVWEETFVGGDATNLGVGYEDIVESGYPSLTVSNIGWSGAGWSMDPGANINTMHWSDETTFHMAYCTTATAPAAIGVIIADGKNAGSAPAKIAIGGKFDDNGVPFPLAGDKITDEWQAIDITFANLKKLWPEFNYVKAESWEGNLVSVLAGGVEGTNISLDAMYFHTPGKFGTWTPEEDDAVDTVAADALFVVTRNTVNVANGNGIALYDLSGRLIKSANGTTLGISDLGNGIYVAKSGNSVKKIMK